MRRDAANSDRAGLDWRAAVRDPQRIVRRRRNRLRRTRQQMLEGTNRATALDRAMMRRALELAKQAAALEEVPVGAVIYRGEEIIAEAHNTRETLADPTGHAELIAIRAAAERLGAWRLTDCSLAVTLEPCPMCAGAIVNARIPRVIFGAFDPKAGACSSLYSITTDKRLNHQVDLIAGVMERECGKLLSDFFRERRRIKREKIHHRGAEDTENSPSEDYS